MSMHTALKTKGLLAGALAASFAFLAVPETAEAQEIHLTGPLAGAPAVRNLRLYRKGRIELAPNATFTLLDEYQRHILFGLRANYHFTDWLGLGVWGAHGTLKLPTALSEHIQDVNAERKAGDPNCESVSCRLTEVNLGQNFEDQLGTIDWVVAPQLTFVPFRGKLGLFNSVFVDADLYLFGGAGIVGISDRGSCDTDCFLPENFELESRSTVTGTFGLGTSFYLNRWMALGAEWRALPFSWNTGGFDTRGGGANEEFPDDEITDADQQFRFNQMLTVSLSFYLPMQYQVSE